MNCQQCHKNPAIPGIGYCGACIKLPVNMLTPSQYREALKRFLQYMEDGGDPWYKKGTPDEETAWGLCAQQVQMWPDRETHLLPPFESEVIPKNLPTGYPCPMDRATDGRTPGCFFRCRVYQGPMPTRAEAIQLFQLGLEKLHGP